MNAVQRIAKNTAVLLVADLIARAFGFFFVMYTARYLGASGFGVLSFAMAFAGVFAIFTDVGLQQLTIREVAKNRSLAAKYLANSAGIRLVFCVVAFGSGAIMISLLPYPKETMHLVYLMCLGMGFGTFTKMFISIFYAFERMEFAFIDRILNSGLMLAGALYTMSGGHGVIALGYVYVVTNAVCLGCAGAICTWRFAAPKLELDWEFWKTTLKEALPFGMTSVFVSVYYCTDTLMLSFMTHGSDAAVGWYNAAYKVVIALLTVPSVYFTAIFPVMSRLHNTSRGSLNIVYERSFRDMVILAIPMGVAVTVFADDLVLLVFGAEYGPSACALRILVWSSVLICLGTVFSRLLEATGKQAIVARITGLMALLNVLLNLLLIPKYTYIGASVATVATMVGSVTLNLGYDWRLGYPLAKKRLLDAAKVLAGSIVLCVIIKLFRIGLIQSALLFLGSYGVFLCVVRLVDKEDMYLIKRIVATQES
jgi:O-antigen/teichoic acid export membrane protein